MPRSVLEKFMLALLTVVIPLVAKWVEREERKILRDGVPLDRQGLLDAGKMGVSHPEKIRLMKVDHIPILNSRFMKLLSRVIPPVSASTVGLSLGYGIYVRSRYWGNRRLVAHECVHTAQYERYASRSRFLRDYFSQCLKCGYPSAPLEQEAILRSAELERLPGESAEKEIHRESEGSEPDEADVGDTEGTRARALRRVVLVRTKQHGVFVNQPKPESRPEKNE